MRPSLRKFLFLIFGLALMGFLLYLSRNAIKLKSFNWVSFGAAVRAARLDLLMLTVAAIYACYFLRAMRWVRFCRHLGPSSLWRVYQATLMGFAAMFLLGRTGEPVRPLVIARREKFSVSSMLGIYVIERVFDLATTIILAGMSLVFLPALLAEYGGERGPALALLQKGGALVLVSLLAAVGFLVYLQASGGGAVKQQLDRWRVQTGWRARVGGLFGGFLEGLRAIRTGGDLAMAAALTAVHWTLIVYIYHWVPASFGGQFAEFDLRAAVLVLACTMLGSTVQLPIIGGSQLACFLAFTVFLGVEKEPAAAAAVMLWLVTFVSCGIAGIPLLMHEGMSLGELRRLAGAERAAPEAGTRGGEDHRPEGASR